MDSLDVTKEEINELYAVCGGCLGQILRHATFDQHVREINEELGDMTQAKLRASTHFGRVCYLLATSGISCVKLSSYPATLTKGVQFWLENHHAII